MSALSKEILDTITWSTHREKQMGGQHCGIPNYGVKLHSDEFDFTISCAGFRTMAGNKEFCMTVFELYLAELKITK